MFTQLAFLVAQACKDLPDPQPKIYGEGGKVGFKQQKPGKTMCNIVDMLDFNNTGVYTGKVKMKAQVLRPVRGA